MQGECSNYILRILQDVRTEIIVEKGHTNINNNGRQEGMIYKVTGRKGHNLHRQSQTRDRG